MRAAVALLSLALIGICSISVATEPTPKPTDAAKPGTGEKAAAPAGSEDQKEGVAATQSGTPSRRRVEDGVLIIPAEEIGVIKKGSFRPVLIGREVAQLKRLQARLEAGIELRPEQKTRLDEMFAKAERDVRSDRVDPRVIDPNPERGVVISDGSEEAGLCDPSKKSAPGAPSSSQEGGKADKGGAAGAGADASGKPAPQDGDQAKAEGKTGAAVETGPLKAPQQKVRVELPPGFDAPPARLNDYVFTMRDQMRELFDDEQEKKFEVIFERWRVMHPMGPVDGPYTRLMRMTRDPALDLSTEHQSRLRGIIIESRKGTPANGRTTLEERTKMADGTKSKLLAELNDAQRKTFNAALAELEFDDNLAAKVAEEYREGGVRVRAD